MSERLNTAQCGNCGHEVTPLNPRAKMHLCRTCLRDEIQVADR